MRLFRLLGSLAASGALVAGSIALSAPAAQAAPPSGRLLIGIEGFSDPPGTVNAIEEPDGTVFVKMVPTIERLIRECPVDSEDPWEWDAWWGRAKWVVPHLWD